MTLNHDDLAFLQYTGGPTGVAKGVMLSHGNMVANVLQVAAWIARDMKDGEETALIPLPLYHVYALTSNRVYIKIGAHIVLALQTIPSRNVDPVDSAVISIGFMRGGSAYNVIPDELHIGGTVRSFRPEVRELLERRIGEVARGAASLHGASAELEYRRGYPPTINHATEASFAADQSRPPTERELLISCSERARSAWVRTGPGTGLLSGSTVGAGGRQRGSDRHPDLGRRDENPALHPQGVVPE